MTHKVKTIDVHELKKLYETNPDLYLIDVREQDEWNELHIPGAHHIPKDELPNRITTVATLDKTTPIYLHCKGGVRSLDAAIKLMDMGYQAVYSVEGGIIDWAKSGYPLET